jgi:hypothetical protein
MPIEDRNLQAGFVLVGRHKGTAHRCAVVETPEGVRYQVDGGEIFRSPSSAAQHVTGGAVNGWVFWSVEGSEKPRREPTADEPARAKKERAAKKSAKSKAAPKKSAMAKRAKTGKAMRAASKGEASYGCAACGETFPTMRAATQHAMTHTAG